MNRLLSTCYLALGFALTVQGQTPVISPGGVQDAAAYTVNVPQGGVFVVKGKNLTNTAGFSQVSTPPPPSYPKIWNNVKITFTPVSGGAGTDAYMIYTYNVNGVTQLAAVLPSSVAPGNYNVVVTNNNVASAASRTTVVARKFGMITVDSSGSGNAVAQNVVSAAQSDLNRFTTGTAFGYTISPAHPGEYVVTYGTGFGGVTVADEGGAPGQIDFLKQGLDVKVIVGGETITPGFAGRQGQYPGFDQLVFQLPNDVPTGCTVSFQVSVAGQLSNYTTLAIAPAGVNACVSPYYSSTSLSKVDQGGSLVIGNFGLTQTSITISLGSTSITQKSEAASGNFQKYSGSQLATATAMIAATDSCQVFRTVSSDTSSFGVASPVYLDAGDPIPLTGPSSVPAGTQLKRAADYTYSKSPLGPSQTTYVMTQGTYTLTGPGGADVGKFTANMTLGPTFTLGSPLPSAVARSQSLPISWTGGNATDVIVIYGMSSVLLGTSSDGTNTYDLGMFVCTTTDSKLTFTVPSSVLQQLPATPADPSSGSGFLEVISSTQPAQGNGIFTAPLTGGGNIDFGTFVGRIGYFGTTAFQ